MGNQVNSGDGRNQDHQGQETHTPKKKNSNGIFNNIFAQNTPVSPSSLSRKKRTSAKEGLYAEDKLFENYESKLFFLFLF